MVQGLQLMVVGMSTVFVFLGLLVLAMQASAAWFRHFGDTFSQLPVVEPEDDAEIAVVLAAIAHRRGS